MASHPEDDATDADEDPDPDADHERQTMQDRLEDAVAEDDDWAFGFSDPTNDTEGEAAAPGVAKGGAWEGHDWDSYVEAHEEQQKDEKELLREVRDELRGLRKALAGPSVPQGQSGSEREGKGVQKAAQAQAKADLENMDQEALQALADALGVEVEDLANVPADDLADVDPGDLPGVDAETLREVQDALASSAESVLTDLEVTYVSGVGEPAQDSQWVMAKDADAEAHGADWGVSAPLLVTEGTAEKAAEAAESGEEGQGQPEQRKAWAPVLIPEEVDKQGDVIPRKEIEQAAHTFLAKYRQVDTDHDLLDGKGVPIESWTLKDARTFETADGGQSREYPGGTWMLGVEWSAEAWDRIKSGDLSGLSIYGEASQLDLDALAGKAAVSPAGSGSVSRTPNRRATWEDPAEYDQATVAMAAAEAAEQTVKSYMEETPGKADRPPQQGHSGAQDEDREVQRKHIYEPGTEAPSSDEKGQVDSFSEDELRDAGVLPDRR